MNANETELQACFVALMRAAADHEVSEKIAIVEDNNQVARLSGAFASEARRIAGRIKDNHSLEGISPGDANVIVAALRYVAKKNWDRSVLLKGLEQKQRQNISLAFDAIATKLDNHRKTLIQ